ncbi:MAG TPA: Uma2 family endonuclease [Thermoanaerobaculia bacterium]|nr:Uma2 family endonuclease [Thermoanaerobaculia bacterium]
MAIRDIVPHKLTYEDYILFPEDGQRHEILDGEHYVTPAPTPDHQGVSSNLHLKLGPFVRERRLGVVLYAPLDVLLSEHDVTQPDLLFISNQRAGILTKTHLLGAPDLVIEILSNSTRRRDETLKRDLYERFGVLEYWLVDPLHRSVRVFLRSSKGFLPPLRLSAAAGDVLTTPLLPGLKIPVSEIFE